MRKLASIQRIWKIELEKFGDTERLQTSTSFMRIFRESIGLWTRGYAETILNR